MVMMPALTRRQLLLSFFSLSLTGCGYQLRGFSSEKSIPYQYVMVTSQGADGELVRQLKRVLTSFGAMIVTDPNLAEIEILLSASQFQSVPSAIGDYGQISASLVVLTQAIRVRKMNSDAWLIDTKVRRGREVDQSAALSISSTSTLGPERPLAIARESEEVTSDVRSRVVDGIVRIVQQLSPLNVSS
jgi:outer membrane lipopolysaccharide assembly protein LptE/RlpB